MQTLQDQKCNLSTFLSPCAYFGFSAGSTSVALLKWKIQLLNSLQWEKPMAVLPSEPDDVVGPTNHSDKVPSGHGKNIRTRNNSWARELEGSLDTASPERERLISALCSARLKELEDMRMELSQPSTMPIVEEQAEGASRSGRVCELLAGNGLKDNLFKTWAFFLVVIDS
ncbi:hypothetical protein Ancab_029864 [Ancistrocladus abbreviatus]